jgi:hypothetical protein
MRPSMVPAVALAIAAPTAAHAWIFHEHTEIMHVALDRVPPAQRLVLSALWDAARASPARTAKLCNSMTAPPEGTHCVTWSVLPSLAGDHSCSPGDLAHLVEKAEWIADVLEAAHAGTDDFGAAADDIPRRVDLWSKHHLDLALHDAEYRSRASGTEIHFQIPRVSEDFTDHLSRSFGTGAKANALAAYANYHAAALSLASRQRDQVREPAIAWAIILIESYAIHFLEDAFSAGHVVGAWGDGPQRKGTHDYYSEKGLLGQTWADPAHYHAHGDAFLTEVDLDKSSRAVAMSLEQLGVVLAGADVDPTDVVFGGAWYGDANACTALEVPIGLDVLAESKLIRGVAEHVLKPLPEAPHAAAFRNEAGAYLVATMAGHFDAVLSSPTVRGRGLLGLGGGIALEGISAQAHDLYYAFSALGAVSASADGGGAALGLGLHFHVPWAYVPMDGLLWAILALSDVMYGPFIQSAMGPFDLQRKVSLTRDVTFQFSALRSGWLLYYPDYATDRARLEVVAPVFSFQFARAYSAPMTGAVRAEFGFMWAHDFADTGADEDFVGASVTVTTDLRLFP